MPIKAKVIVEVVGKPKEHIKKALKQILEKIEEEEVTVESKRTFPPKPVENFFSTFAELELTFKMQSQILDFCLAYLPSSIEIIEPDEFYLRSNVFSNTLNDFLSRLHSINSQLANTNAENQILKKNTESLLKNIIMLALSKPCTLKQASKKIGINPKQLEPFLQKHIKTGKIKKENDKYSIVESLHNG